MSVKGIPSTVKTSLVNLVMSPYELNEHRHESMVIALMEEKDAVLILGCEQLSDIIFYAGYFGCFKNLSSPEQLTLMRAVVEDPEDLPYDVSYGRKAWVICDILGIVTYKDMSKVTTDIEFIIGTVPGAHIDDFTVIIGTEVNDKIKDRVTSKIIQERETKQWENRNALAL